MNLPSLSSDPELIAACQAVEDLREHLEAWRDMDLPIYLIMFGVKNWRHATARRDSLIEHALVARELQRSALEQVRYEDAALAHLAVAMAAVA